jgi:D-serine deaminase-like pyridoxal phosphate-dependent protein
MKLHSTQTYSYYKNVFKGLPMPFAFVDLDRFDDNVNAIVERAGAKQIRIATKSIRCVALMKRILKSSNQFQGVMAYSAQEAAWLSQLGFDDILIGYPCFHEKDIEAVIAELKKGKQITLMVDLPEHVQQINKMGEQQHCIIPVCIDVDMSSSLPGLHFGVLRSAIQTKEKALQLWQLIQRSPFVKLNGLMGYEAQIAGLNDAIPNKFFMNQFVSFLKKYSIKEIQQRRKDIIVALQAAGATFRFINGGGTGSLEYTSKEDIVTEVTAGSGFYCPGLFDYFSNFQHYPSAGFAIEIVRKPKPNIFTCLGGGYIASGKAGSDKLPKPFLPIEATLINNEGAGEVQTPIQYKGNENLQVGDPVFLRHAKAGELCERFQQLFLVSNGAIVDKVHTYRAENKCFV